jgi:hypothetical protein
MTQPVEILAPAIGACLNCRSLFLVTFDTPNCLTCGRPPELTLSFAPAHPEPVEAPGSLMTDTEYLDKVVGLEPLPAKEEQPAPAELTDEEGVMPPPLTAPEEVLTQEPAPLAQDSTVVAIEALPIMIYGFLEGDVVVDAEKLKGEFEGAGADPETAATAVGRLVAVRDLIAQLAQSQEPAPVAPQGEEDRTIASSP